MQRESKPRRNKWIKTGHSRYYDVVVAVAALWSGLYGGLSDAQLAHIQNILDVCVFATCELF